MFGPNMLYCSCFTKRARSHFELPGLENTVATWGTQVKIQFKVYGNTFKTAVSVVK